MNHDIKHPLLYGKFNKEIHVSNEAFSWGYPAHLISWLCGLIATWLNRQNPALKPKFILKHFNSLEEWMKVLKIVGYFFFGRVEKTLKGSLDSIPSPLTSVKIQIMFGKVWLRGKILLSFVNKFLKTKSLLTSRSNVLPCYRK